jgi:hypothetical protein
MTTLARCNVFPVWQTMSQWQGISLMRMPAALASAVLLADTIAGAVRRRERRTCASIPCEPAIRAREVPFSVKACFYRFVGGAPEEGGQTDARTVRVDCDGDKLQVEVKCTIATQHYLRSSKGSSCEPCKTGSIQSGVKFWFKRGRMSFLTRRI